MAQWEWMAREASREEWSARLLEVLVNLDRAAPTTHSSLKVVVHGDACELGYVSSDLSHFSCALYNYAQAVFRRIGLPCNAREDVEFDRIARTVTFDKAQLDTPELQERIWKAIEQEMASRRGRGANADLAR